MSEFDPILLTLPSLTPALALEVPPQIRPVSHRPADFMPDLAARAYSPPPLRPGRWSRKLRLAPHCPTSISPLARRAGCSTQTHDVVIGPESPKDHAFQKY